MCLGKKEILDNILNQKKFLFNFAPLGAPVALLTVRTSRRGNISLKSSCKLKALKHDNHKIIKSTFQQTICLTILEVVCAMLFIGAFFLFPFTLSTLN